jgi:hypothetical protein
MYWLSSRGCHMDAVTLYWHHGLTQIRGCGLRHTLSVLLLIWYPASLSDHQSNWHNTPHHFDTTAMWKCIHYVHHIARSSVQETEYLYHSFTLHKYMARTINHHPERCRFRAVLSYATHSLSDDPVLSILLGGLHPFFHRVDTVVPVLVSGCLPFCLRAAATSVGSFSPRHWLFLPHRRYTCSTSGP